MYEHLLKAADPTKSQRRQAREMDDADFTKNVRAEERYEAGFKEGDTMTDFTGMRYEQYDGGGIILNDDQVIICDGDPIMPITPTDHIMKEIVKRWNAHEELLEVLEELHKFVNRMPIDKTERSVFTGMIVDVTNKAKAKS